MQCSTYINRNETENATCTLHGTLSSLVSIQAEALNNQSSGAIYKVPILTPGRRVCIK